MASPQGEEMTRAYVPVAQQIPFEKGLMSYVASEIDPELFMIVGSEFSEVLELRIPQGTTISAEPGALL
jgi:hypothetical protein